MKTTAHETKNPFATFSLRGGRLRKIGGGIVSYAPFLTGMVLAAVLGSVFALSTPPFANAEYECGSRVSHPHVSTTTHFVSAVDFVRRDADPVSEREVDVTDTNPAPLTSTTVVTDTHTTTFETHGGVPMSGVYTGVYFYRSGNGDICFNNVADIRDVSYGIKANRDGEGILDIHSGSAITNATY